MREAGLRPPGTLDFSSVCWGLRGGYEVRLRSDTVRSVFLKMT